MSDTYTVNTAMVLPAFNDPSWNVLLNNNFAQIDGLGAIGPLAVRPREIPSTSLYVAVAAGSFRASTFATVTYAGSSGTLLAASLTNYIYLTDSGTLTVNTTGFPASTNIVPLARVVGGASTITSVTDARIPWTSFGGTAPWLPLTGGTFADASATVVLVTGSTHGVQIGSATSQKIGFYGKTPIVQPTMGSATAGGTYTSAEQAMLQAAYNALRNLGLGS